MPANDESLLGGLFARFSSLETQISALAREQEHHRELHDKEIRPSLGDIRLALERGNDKFQGFGRELSDLKAQVILEAATVEARVAAETAARQLETGRLRGMMVGTLPEERGGFRAELDKHDDRLSEVEITARTVATMGRLLWGIFATLVTMTVGVVTLLLRLGGHS